MEGLLYLLIGLFLCVAAVVAGIKVMGPLSRGETPYLPPPDDPIMPVSQDLARSPDVPPPPIKDNGGVVPPQGGTRIAIVMDDCGPSLTLARRVLSLDLPITWSILPGQTYSSEIAGMLRDNDIPFLVHVPMQALVDPDGKRGSGAPYAIGVGMNQKAVRSALLPLLDSLPGAMGVNNHRGSKATQDRALMQFVMAELRARSLAFLDSNTSRETIAYDVARKNGLKALKNGHFLDNEADRKAVAREMEAAYKLAEKRGDLVVICHLRPETVVFLEGLAKQTESRKARNIRLVTLTELLQTANTKKR